MASVGSRACLLLGSPLTLPTVNDPFRREKDCVSFLPSHCHCCHWIRRNVFIHPFILEREVCALGTSVDTGMYPSCQGIVGVIPDTPTSSKTLAAPPGLWVHSVTQ